METDLLVLAEVLVGMAVQPVKAGQAVAAVVVVAELLTSAKMVPVYPIELPLQVVLAVEDTTAVVKSVVMAVAWLVKLALQNTVAAVELNLLVVLAEMQAVEELHHPEHSVMAEVPGLRQPEVAAAAVTTAAAVEATKPVVAEAATLKQPQQVSFTHRAHVLVTAKL